MVKPKNKQAERVAGLTTWGGGSQVCAEDMAVSCPLAMAAQNSALRFLGSHLSLEVTSLG